MPWRPRAAAPRGRPNGCPGSAPIVGRRRECGEKGLRRHLGLPPPTRPAPTPHQTPAPPSGRAPAAPKVAPAPALATLRRLASTSAPALHDRERHAAAAVLGAALALWLLALLAGVAAATGAVPAASAKGHALSAFDTLLRRAGALLPAPVLAARALAHSRLPGARGSARPGRHFVEAAGVYIAAAAVRLSIYLPHRAGHLSAALGAARAAPGWLLRSVAGGGGAAAAGTPAERARAAAAALLARLVRVKTPSADHHLMADHVFLGACVAAVLAAEGALLAADARRGGHGPARRNALKAGLALCALLYLLLVADMFNTARFFHARHETGAALAAGAVAFQAPLAAWLLRRR